MAKSRNGVWISYPLPIPWISYPHPRANESGGIFNSGTLTLTQSTVSGNDASAGGGIYSFTSRDLSTSSTTILNSTISGNTASGGGGGVYNVNGLTRIVHSTITGNTAPNGGGVWSFQADHLGTARTDVLNSIIWGNTSDGTTANDVAARFTTPPATRYNSLGYNLIGQDWSDDHYRGEMRQAVRTHCEGSVTSWTAFAQRLHYVRGDAQAPADFAALAAGIARVRGEHGIADNLLFHLAVPPVLFGIIAERLGAAGLAQAEHGWRRLIIEKPFGTDRASAVALDHDLRDVFGEEQIYRVDHFLGKETVQNMLVFRFGNPGFEPIWNRNYIDHVQITVAEEIGIGTRASFYEQTGVVRDMIQNHLLQLLCMIAMEPPVAFQAKSLRDETARVLDAVNVVPIDIEHGAVRGQYDSGSVHGERVHAYRAEDGVAPDSTTATYAALKLTVDNWRWAGVPFYLRTGKRMTRGLTEVALQFRPTPYAVFALDSESAARGSVLVFEVQPNEGIVQTLAAKQPGPDLVVQTVTMDFRYAEAFGVEKPPRAYAWLILDAKHGDQTLFARADWIDRAWQIVDPVIERWESQPPADFPNYAAGTAGPVAADRMLERDGRRWRSLKPPGRPHGP